MSKLRIIFILSLILLAFLYGNNTVKIQIFNNETIVKQTEYIVNETTCYEYKTIEVVKEKIQIRNMTKTIDITDEQKSKIINANIGCHTIGCGEGAVRMKYYIMNILKYPTPKFSERPSIGFDNYDNRTYLPVEKDGLGEYIKLDDYWYIFKGNKEYNLTFLCNGNNTWIENYERTNDGYYDINVTHTFDNLNYSSDSKWMPAQGNEIYLRHI